MSESVPQKPGDRFWHLIWAVAGVAALGYGIVGIIAQFTQPNRHILALPWFIVAAVGGVSMISFVWKSKD
jgi:hypothetical protein